MPVTGDLRLSNAGIRAFLEKPGGEVDDEVSRVAHRVGELARQYAPVGRGAPDPRYAGTGGKRLNTSIVVRKNTSGKSWTVSARKPYAGAVLHGSRPHRIYAKNRRALHFEGGSAGSFPGRGAKGAERADGTHHASGDGFSAWVDHPGTRKGDNFLERALEQAMREHESGGHGFGHPFI